MDYEAVIGLEVHVQIKTKSKLFTACPYWFGAPPNTLTDEQVLGLPGTLPVINKEAIVKTIKAGLIFGCDIAKVTKWDRKNYFYPDCPKNYQISQSSDPICRGGSVEIELPGPARNIMGQHKEIALDRIHLEEDVGKLTHFCDDSCVDFNRAGVALMEIVSKPDIRSADEAFAYLNSLKSHLVFADISSCDMEKGEMRCDANISIRKVGDTTFGTKVEIKNLNSISGVRNGIDYEIRRQIDELGSGGSILQETRRWDATTAKTYGMRTKETAFDYRYFPDPDLMPIKISDGLRESIRSEITEMPFDKQRRFFSQYGLAYTITSVICFKRELSEFFERAVAAYYNPQAIANFVANDMLRELSNANMSGSDALLITPDQLAELVKLIDSGVISKQIAQDVFVEIFHTGKAPQEIIDTKNLRQKTDLVELNDICQAAIDNNKRAVEEFRAGKLTAINAIKGAVMKQTKGQANPIAVDKILRDLLKS